MDRETSSEKASTSDDHPGSIRNPRRRAVPPTMSDVTQSINKDPDFKDVTSPLDPARVEAARAAVSAALPSHIADALEQGPRVGPYLIQWGVWYGGAGAIAATYAYGFYGLLKKDQKLWASSFRNRIFILGPMISAYCTAHGVVPMPFRASLEQWTGRPAVTLSNILARDELQKQKAAELRALGREEAW